MSNLRTARMSDLVSLVRMARLFWEESPYTGFTFSRRRVAELIRGMIDDPTFAVFVTEQDNKVTGMIIGQKVQPTFSEDWMALEVAWYVEQEYRNTSAGLRLVNAYTKWQKEQGCKLSALTMLSTSPKRLKEVYTHLGYNPVEITYQKVN